MKQVVSSSNFLTAFLAGTAITTTPTYGFVVRSLTRSLPPSKAALGMSSYDEQLNAYYGSVKKVYSPAVDANLSVNGAVASQQPPAEPAAAPERTMGYSPINNLPPNPAAVNVNIPASALLFLGLPLWILLSLQLFVGGNGNLVAPNPTTTAPQISLPASTPNLSNGGVIVLSQPITKTEVRGLFNLWNDALQTLDPAIVAKRYGTNGVLLPTLSDVPRNDVEGIKDYFVGFLKKKPVGKILEGDIFVGNNWAQDAGIYEFTFEDGSKVKARYSFIYAYEDGQWLISHHHSSLMPQEVVRPTPITADEVRALFDLWNDALATGDPTTVAARYSPDAVLLPTLSDSARYTNDRIADYFVGFLKKKPRGEILEGNVKIGPNWAQDAGIYEFTFEDGSKTRGRYSFVYAYENNEWKISNHHSSIMPEPAVAAMKKAAELNI